ncbi:phosphoribosyltransferase [Rhodococcus sp. X156]|uniref:phosphoribosyltransferase n=1 Tax=Rhodococcus sp. X156 TaxID=2499145 RepID=UPI000FD9AB8F|nr:phosphoribosyltransferase [Rhodococcus sp. X156]
MSGWTGSWVHEHLGVQLEGASGDDLRVEELVGLALRRNPRRAHLLVSRVLGKHVPTDPRLVRAAGLLLGARVAAELGAPAPTGWQDPVRAALAGHDGAARDLRDRAVALGGAGVGEDVCVLGYAETATGLGHLVAEALDADVYLHSTRRHPAGAVQLGRFAEEHSHATEHRLLPRSPELLTGTGPLVLVDDELSTGRTVRNTLAMLHAIAPRPRYVVAALIDLRSAEDEAALQELATELGAQVSVVSLARGRVQVPAEALRRGAELVQAHSTPQPAPAPPHPVRRVALDWPVTLPDGGRHGVQRPHRAQLEQVLPALAAQLDAALQVPAGGSVLVLGTEELMHAPLRLAEALADRLDDRGVAVRSSTTTRSPVLAVDDPGYAIRGGITFPAHDDPVDGPGPRFAYNVGRPDAVVVVVDDVADTPQLAGLLDALPAPVLLVTLPSAGPLPTPLHGPEFGSYAADEVTWLLKDLSAVALEAPVEEREEAVQNGGAHYAESLPVEYQPDPAYLALFQQALTGSARRLAHAVGVLTELLLAERGPDLVLASLARAGTPVGILVRRWAQHVHGLQLPHYAVSIVRGRGIDPVALRYLAAHHDPAAVVFVDGWTGKGAITSELTAALAEHELATGARFNPDLAVLADPGRCVRTFGTREDYLIASACLNSTVSGLVSRTVLNATHIGPADFHGAKFYAELAGSDVSTDFLDAVTAHFDAVRAEVASSWPHVAAGDREPTWSGWAAVREISEAYGIGQENLVKPGVGETTRVLLRRVPWKVLVRPDARAELGHVLLLAERRGVPVEDVADLAYSCVGLIHPRYTRGATGADGAAAQVLA